MHRLLSISAVLVAASPALAEVSVGGDAHVELNFADFGDGFEKTVHRIEGEVIATTELGALTLGGGLRFNEIDEDFGLGGENLIVLAGYRDVTLTFHQADASEGTFGAGTLLSEDYFGMGDVTSPSNDLLRVDYAGDRLHLAVSRNLNTDAASDNLEIAVATEVFEHFVRAGYGQREGALMAIVGRDLGAWGYHVAARYEEADADGRQLGGTVLWDVSDALRVAANVATSAEDSLHSWGIVAWYELAYGKGLGAPATLRAEYRDATADDFQTFELSIHVPFGKAPPAATERKDHRDVLSGFAFY